MSDTRTIETPLGIVALRPERTDDEDFLFALFSANRIGILKLARIPEDAVAELIALQYRSQTATYRTLYPEATYSIVEREGAAVGRLIENDETREVYFVDIALMPDVQRRGVGRAIIRALRDVWAGRGRAARAKVAIENEASMQLFRGLGFAPVGTDEHAYVTLRWKPTRGRMRGSATASRRESASGMAPLAGSKDG
jgi:ribosomal protein S18 acetylase RimI-like enzyme